MIELFKTFSITEIIIFIALLAIAVKGVVDFYDWARARLGKNFKKEDEIEKRITQDEAALNQVVKNQEKNNQKLVSLMNKIDTLIVSDRDDIKSFITEKHHYFVNQQKWIDDYSLDCIERRYDHYKEEGGNSYIHDLMKEIRALEKHPPA